MDVTHIDTARAETAGLRQNMKLPAALRRLNEGDRIVVETTRNELRFISNSQVVFKAACLTGKGKEFIDPLDGRTWALDTPQREFCITAKIWDLLWAKSHGTFIENGIRYSANGKNRFQDGLVEECMLRFGDHYAIHGMLYTKSPARNAIRGCIRLNDEDLYVLFKRTRVGTPLLITS